ncbi:MAG: hypothetical protein QM756_07020 [Polyangiaceae bacterium]
MGTPPFEEREVAVLVGALLLVGCTRYFLRDFKRVPSWQMLGLAMCSLVLGNVFTVVEHFVAFNLFNHLEHAAYAVQSLLVAAWAIRLQRA